MELQRCRTAEEITDVEAFLRAVDLTVTGLDAPTVQLWVERAGVGAGGGGAGAGGADGADGTGVGRILGSTGWEVSADGLHALIRSVAVAPERRALGRGRALASFALERAAAEGAHTAWLFSRRSGAFWQSLGFVPADRDELANVLADTHQVRGFRHTGRLDREIAWRRSLRRE